MLDRAYVLGCQEKLSSVQPVQNAAVGHCLAFVGQREIERLVRGWQRLR